MDSSHDGGAMTSRQLSLGEKQPKFSDADEWTLPTDPDEFRVWLAETGIAGSAKQQLKTFMTFPAALTMPESLRKILGVEQDLR